MSDTPLNGNGPDHSDRFKEAAAEIQRSWDEDPRFAGIERRYEAEEVVRLRGSVTSSTRSHARVPSGSGICCTSART